MDEGVEGGGLRMDWASEIDIEHNEPKECPRCKGEVHIRVFRAVWGSENQEIQDYSDWMFWCQGCGWEVWREEVKGKEG